MDISNSIEIMKSLADTSRLRILNSLMDNPQYVEELSHRLNLAASTISFHLKKLESAGLVTQTKEQYYIVYKDKLIQLPVQKKKRIIILDEFAKKFKSGKKYAEEDVNELIKQNYDDYCTIRRLLIEEGIMKRDKQFFWLINE